MLTPKGLKELERITKLSSLLGLAPFKWNHSKKPRKPIIAISTRHYRIWIFQLMLHALYIIPVYTSLLERIILGNTEDRANFVLHLLFSVGFLQSVLFNASALAEQENYQLLLNSVINFKSIVGGVVNRKRVNLLEKMLPVIIPVGLSNPCMMVLIFLQNPAAPCYLYRYFAGIDGSKRLLPLFALFEFYNYLQHFIYLTFHWAWVIFTSSILTSEALAVLGEKLKTGGNNKAKFDEILKSFKRLQIFNGIFNICSSSLTWPCISLVFGLALSFCIYVMVKLHSTLNLAGLVFFSFWSLNFIPLQMVVYSIGGEVYERSQELLRVLRGLTSGGGEGNSRLKKRELRALHPLGVHTANLHRMDKCTFLGVMFIVSNVTLNALLLF